MTRQLAPTRTTVHDVFSRDHEPVLVVEPGERIRVGSLDASGHLERMTEPGRRPPTLLGDAARGHCLTGPIAVRGAQPGDLLAVHLESMEPAPWGWTAAAVRETPVTRRLGLDPASPAWLLWDVADGVATSSIGLARRTAPFLGVLGTAPAEPGEHSTVPPRAATGGNIDCRELVAGSTLLLPVQVPGALLYVGDGHAAQGDGEVGGTAIECGMTTVLRLEVVPAAARPLDGVHAETPAGRVAFGFDADLNAAAGDALDAMVRWIAALHGLERATALALASAAVDLRVTQVANGTWGVHALLPDGLLTAAP